MKYRYTLVNEGVVEADNKAEAEAAAFQSCDEGRGVDRYDVEAMIRDAVSDLRGTITSYLELQVADAFTPPDPFSRKI